MKKILLLMVLAPLVSCVTARQYNALRAENEQLRDARDRADKAELAAANAETRAIAADAQARLSGIAYANVLDEADLKEANRRLEQMSVRLANAASANEVAELRGEQAELARLVAKHYEAIERLQPRLRAVEAGVENNTNAREQLERDSAERQAAMTERYQPVPVVVP